MEGREQTGRVNHALAERINQYILEQKSSIAAISKEIGYSRTSVSRYLREYDGGEAVGVSGGAHRGDSGGSGCRGSEREAA